MTAIFGCVLLLPSFLQAYSYHSYPLSLDSDPESKYFYSTYRLATRVIFSTVKNPTSSCKRPLWPFYRRQMRSFGPWHDVYSRYVNDIWHFVSSLSFLLTKTRLIAPIAWPISKLLDRILSTEHHTYKKAELKSFLQFHRTGDEPLRDDEITILNGVLELNTKKVETIMTPLQVCLFIDCFIFIYIYI